MSSQSDLTDGHKKMVLNTKGPLTLVLLMEVSFWVYPPFTGFLLPSLNEKKKKDKIASVHFGIMP